MAARRHLEQVLVYYQTRPRITYILDPKVGSLVYMALGSCLCGQLKRARHEIATACTWAQELGHPYNRAVVFIGEVILGLFLRGTSFPHQRADTIVALCREHNFSQYEALGSIIEGWEFIETGQIETGVRQLREGLTACRATGLECGLTPWLIQLAIGYGRLRQVAAGLSILNETITSTDRRGEGLFAAELYRVKGELLLAQESKRQKTKGKKQK